MGKSLEDQMREAIDEIENCSHLEAWELSEAERAAAAASPPTLRVDRQPVGSPDRKQWRVLTEAQETFVEHVIRGKTLRASYKLAYPNQTGNDRTISAAAQALMKNPRIISALEEAAEESVDHMVEDAGALRRYITKQLLIRVQGASNDMAAFRGLELLARSAGMFVQTPLVETQAPTPEQIKRDLDQHLTMLEDVSPRRKRDAARKARKQQETTGIDEASAAGGETDGSGEDGVG